MKERATQNLGDESLEMMEKIGKTIQEAERLIQETDDFYREVGLTRGMAKQILYSDRVDPELRGALRDELTIQLDDWARETQEADGIGTPRNGGNNLKTRQFMNLQLNSI